MARICSECNKEVDSSFKFCPHCFTDFEIESENQTLAEIDSISSIGEDESEDGFLNYDGDSDGDAPPGELLFAQRYRLLEPLKSASSGTICLVQDYKTEKLYIMKDFIIERKKIRARESLKQELLSMAKSFSKFSCDSMSRIVDAKIENDTLYFIYDFYEGIDLASYIDNLKKTEQFIGSRRAAEWAKTIISIIYTLRTGYSEPHYCGNLLPYSFVVSPDGNKINYINLGLPYIYIKMGICDPFEDEWTDGDKLKSPSYDLCCLGSTLYYLITGTNSEEPDMKLLKRLATHDLYIITEKLLSLEPYAEIAPGFLEEIRNEILSLYKQSSEPTPLKEVVVEPKLEDWSSFLGDFQRRNSSYKTSSPYLNVLWTMVIKAESQFYTAPWGDNLVVMSDRGSIYEFELLKPNLLKKKFLNESTVSAIIFDGLFYINSSSSQMALKLDTLETKWEFRTKSMFLSPPNLIEDKIMTVSYDGFMMIVDRESGTPVSTENVDQKVIAPIAYDEERYFIPSLVGQLLAINRETRVVDWVQNLGTPLTTAPAVFGDFLFVGSSAGMVICANKNTGERIWVNQIKGALSQGPAVTENKIICSSANGSLACFDIASGKKIWEIDFGQNFNCAFCAPLPFIYAVGPDNSLLSINAENGRIYSQINFKSKICSTPIFINQTLYIVTQESEICALSMRT